MTKNRLFTAVNTEIIHGRIFLMNSTILELDNHVVFVCTNGFKVNKQGEYKLLAWLPGNRKWVSVYANNKFTDAMYRCYRQTRKSGKSKMSASNVQNMMKHDRVHKHGSGGSRIFNGSITDYETRKRPLHDFNRGYNFT
jgi:hypothetical protein|uniref:Uncharacterized protein n=1 Tax=virus sp. ctmTa7 TaxID=2828255 RepID=A0A8S5RCY5_9VIRU|nr:MAG TPA: hypothetical protein [virus sp. ctmTa7]